MKIEQIMDFADFTIGEVDNYKMWLKISKMTDGDFLSFVDKRPFEIEKFVDKGAAAVRVKCGGEQVGASFVSYIEENEKLFFLEAADVIKCIAQKLDSKSTEPNHCFDIASSFYIEQFKQLDD